MEDKKLLDEIKNIIKEELEVIVKDEIIELEENLIKIRDKADHLDFKLSRINDRMDISDLRVRMIEVSNKEEFHLLHDENNKIVEILRQ